MGYVINFEPKIDVNPVNIYTMSVEIDPAEYGGEPDWDWTLRGGYWDKKTGHKYYYYSEASGAAAGACGGTPDLGAAPVPFWTNGRHGYGASFTFPGGYFVCNSLSRAFWSASEIAEAVASLTVGSFQIQTQTIKTELLTDPSTAVAYLVNLVVGDGQYHCVTEHTIETTNSGAASLQVAGVAWDGTHWVLVPLFTIAHESAMSANTTKVVDFAGAVKSILATRGQFARYSLYLMPSTAAQVSSYGQSAISQMEALLGATVEDSVQYQWLNTSQGYKWLGTGTVKTRKLTYSGSSISNQAIKSINLSTYTWPSGGGIPPKDEVVL